MDNGGSSETNLLILYRLDQLEKKVDSLIGAVNKNGNEISGLKVKSGIWGAIAGVIPVIIALALSSCG